MKSPDFSPITVAANATKADLEQALERANAVIADAEAAVQERDDALEALQVKLLEADTLAVSLRKQLDADAAKPKAAGAAVADGTYLRVASSHPNGGHNRAGRRWTREAQTVPKATFTPEQVEQLKGDPLLIVVEA